MAADQLYPQITATSPSLKRDMVWRDLEELVGMVSERLATITCAQVGRGVAGKSLAGFSERCSSFAARKANC